MLSRVCSRVNDFFSGCHPSSRRLAAATPLSLYISRNAPTASLRLRQQPRLHLPLQIVKLASCLLTPNPSPFERTPSCKDNPAILFYIGFRSNVHTLSK